MSLENDITEIKRILEAYLQKVTTADPETETQPTTAPADPDKKTNKPVSPIRPTPGITPRPKALTADAILFLKKRNLNGRKVQGVQEATPASPLQGVSKDKKKWIETGDEQLNAILPQLSEKEQKYLVTIASEEYANVVSKIEEYTGIKVKPGNLPSLVYLLLETLGEVNTIENANKHYLEELALDLVFQVPEFKMVEQAYLDDDLSFDIALGNPDLTNLVNGSEEIEGLTPDEDLNLKMADLLKDSTNEDFRRRFSNLMISGGSINKLYLYNMVKEKLNALNPDLTKYYGILSSVAQIGYWCTPFGIESAAASSEGTKAGSEEVIPNGDKYIIKVRGTTFPYLVHELVKGIMEYISLDPSLQISMRKDKVEDETKDIIAGPGVYRAVVSYIPNDKQELIPLVQKKLIGKSSDEIRDILAKNENGKAIMRQVIADADREWAEYKKSKEGSNAPERA